MDCGRSRCRASTISSQRSRIRFANSSERFERSSRVERPRARSWRMATGRSAVCFMPTSSSIRLKPRISTPCVSRPNDGTWLHLLGYLYQQTGRLDEAADRFEQALRVQPDDRAAAVRLGQVYLSLNRLREAREQFQSVDVVFPTLSRNGLGEVALRERRYDEAVSHFRAVLERVPQATSVHYSLAMAYRGLGRLDEARAELERRGPGGLNVGDPIVDSLQTLVRGERGLVAQGRTAYEAGQFKEAAVAFAKAIDGRAVERDGESQSWTDATAVGEHGGGDRDAASTPSTLRRRTRMRAVSLFACCCAPVARKTPFACWRSRTRSTRTMRRRSSALRSCSHSRTAFARRVALLAEGNQRFPERTATATTLARLLASSPDLSVRDGTARARSRQWPCTAPNRHRCMARRSRSRWRSSDDVTRRCSG